MTDHVTTQTLKDDLSTVLRDAEALIKASAEHGGEKTADRRQQAAARPARVALRAGGRTEAARCGEPANGVHDALARTVAPIDRRAEGVVHPLGDAGVGVIAHGRVTGSWSRETMGGEQCAQRCERRRASLPRPGRRDAGRILAAVLQ